jgi:hypothetical protein
MSDWWSIEVFHDEAGAWMWWLARQDGLIEAAITNRALDWAWRRHSWGVVFEVRFEEDWQWERFYALPVVQAALDAVPDPLAGLLVHRGRGGSAGARSPRTPRPVLASGAAALPEPTVELHAMLV